MDTLLAFFMGLIIGIGYYFLDFKQFKPWYRNWYKLTHKDPLPAESDLGFVFGQPFSGKLYTAVFLSFVITAIIILTGSDNILVQLLYGVFIVVGLILGFYVSPFIFRHGPTRLKKLKKAIDKIDQIEAGMTDKQKVPEAPKPEPVQEKEKEEKPKEKEAEQEEKKDDDWRKGVKDFLDK